jgi:hypothetical protein
MNNCEGCPTPNLCNICTARLSEEEQNLQAFAEQLFSEDDIKFDMKEGNYSTALEIAQRLGLDDANPDNIQSLVAAAIKLHSSTPHPTKFK